MMGDMAEVSDLAGWHGEEVAGFTVARRRARAAELFELGELVDAGVWSGYGFRSASAWLATATGETLGGCKRSVHLADRLRRMPIVSEVFATGAMSEAALGLLCDAWAEAIADVFARDEALLARWAADLPYGDAKVVIETWVAHADPERIDRSGEERYDRRRLHLSSLLDGMARLDGVLDPEGATYVAEALRWLSKPSTGDGRTAAQRRHDALIEMARFTLTYRESPPGEKRRRPKIVVNTDVSDLCDRARAAHAPGYDEPHGPDGVGGVDGVGGADGVGGVGGVAGAGWSGGYLGSTLVGGDAVRRLACDAGLHRLVVSGRSTLLDYGRQTRSISDPLFDVLAVRDGGCRWPGCEVPAWFCDGHHALHWADLGETEPDNLALLCWHHHHLVHEDGWCIEPLGAGNFRLHTPAGLMVAMSPPRLVLTDCA